MHFLVRRNEFTPGLQGQSEVKAIINRVPLPERQPQGPVGEDSVADQRWAALLKPLIFGQSLLLLQQTSRDSQGEDIPDLCGQNIWRQRFQSSPHCLEQQRHGTVGVSL